MPDAAGSGASPGSPLPKASLSQRLLLMLPRLGRDQDRPPLKDRLRDSVLKPSPAPAADPGTGRRAPARPDIEELRAAVRNADDKERLVGILGAPLAAAIGILSINSLIAQDPPATKNGHANSLHVSLALYHELELLLLGLAVLMLVLAGLRKRLFLGAAMALYGLAVLDLHYWGFGLPFMMAGAWLIVRSYRAQRDLKEALAGDTGGRGGRPRPAGNGARPRQNRRYTPPR